MMKIAWTLKWLWWRHTWRFIWAHKPLCDRFRHDVIRVGSLTLCRSCTLVYSAAAITLLIALCASDWIRPWAWQLLVLSGGATLVFSFPPWYRHWSRGLRDLVRSLLGVTIAWGIYLILQGSVGVGFLGLAFLWLMWKIYQPLRRRNKQDACHGCPELAHHGICSGFSWQADYVRIYEQQASDFLMQHSIDHLNR